jgi:hypothetical protein
VTICWKETIEKNKKNKQEKKKFVSTHCLQVCSSSFLPSFLPD